jgi:malate dehydrogenase
LAAALKGAEIVLIPAGVPRKPGMTRDDLFNTNASIVRDLAKAAAESAPDANILVISNPVNSTVPIVAEIFKARGVYNPKRLFGVTTLDVVRASRFVSEIKNTDPKDENITVVGGHSGVTIVPLFSQSSHPDLVGNAELLNRVQFGGDEVVKAKDGAGSATLSMAMAGARFAESLLRAAQGEKGVVEPTFVDSPLYKDQGVEFFASKVELGPNGVEKIHEIGKVTGEEQKLLDAAIADLKKACYPPPIPSHYLSIKSLLGTNSTPEYREGRSVRCPEPRKVSCNPHLTSHFSRRLEGRMAMAMEWREWRITAHISGISSAFSV